MEKVYQLIGVWKCNIYMHFYDQYQEYFCWHYTVFRLLLMKCQHGTTNIGQYLQQNVESLGEATVS